MTTEQSIEFTILQSLIASEEYTRKVLPFLKPEYFKEQSDKIVFDLIDSFFLEYNKTPSREILQIALQEKEGVPEKIYADAMEKIQSFCSDVSVNVDWATDMSERFCKDRALYDAITKAIHIADGQDKQLSTSAIPSILQEALSVCFDTKVGHDYFNSAEERYEKNTDKAAKMPFVHSTLNAATEGGYESQTLNLIMAPSNVGKTIILCDLAAGDISLGRNVLYITMEMAENKIAGRIDCNLLDTEFKHMKNMDKSSFMSRISQVKQKSQGRLFVKQFPTSLAHAGHFRTLLTELKNKENFTPDTVYVDYLSIVASQKYKSSNYNSYAALGFVAQELRGLAVESNVAMWSAIQTNRSGYNNSDVDEQSVAESMSIYHIADLVLAAIRTEELDKMFQIMFKQLKSRYANKSEMSRFLMGLNINKFKLSDIDNPAELVDTVSMQMMKAPAATTSNGFSGFQF